jgi:hypothetical protein
VCSCMQFDLLAANCHSWLCACSMGEGERERVASSRGVGLRARVMDAIETSNAKAAALRRLHARRSIDRPTGKAAAAETASLARKRHGSLQESDVLHGRLHKVKATNCLFWNFFPRDQPCIFPNQECVTYGNLSLSKLYVPDHLCTIWNKYATPSVLKRLSF